MQFYVYLHIKPEGRLEDIFYVGKGTEERVKLLRRRNKHHANIVNKYGKENIIVRSLECDPEAHAFKLEVEVIAVLRRIGVNICNRTDGGEGCSNPTDETRARMSAHRKGAVLPEEWRENISRSLVGNTRSVGRIHPGRTRAKMSESHRLSPLRPDNTSGHKGIQFRRDRGKWHARIGIGGGEVNLGHYTTLEEAIAARKAGELKYWGVAA